MAKEKNSSDTPTPKKTAAKKSPAKKAAVKKTAAKKPVAAEIAVATAAAPLSTSPAQTLQPPVAQLHEEIRHRAYELYRARGGEHGLHETDWHRAESEVRSKYKA